MWQMVRGLQQRGVTIILTTHYIEEAEEMADRIGVIRQGEIILVEGKTQLMQRFSRKRLTLQLLSHLGARAAEPRQYWLSSIQSDHVLSTASHFDAYWREVFGCRQLVRAGMPRNEVLLRPADELELLGAERLVHARLGDEMLIIRTHEDQGAPAIGSTIRAQPREDRLHWFNAETGKRI